MIQAIVFYDQGAVSPPNDKPEGILFIPVVKDKLPEVVKVDWRPPSNCINNADFPTLQSRPMLGKFRYTDPDAIDDSKREPEPRF